MNAELVRKAEALLKEAYASEGKPKISSPKDSWGLPAMRKIAKDKQECFLVLTLDGAHQLIKSHIISRGLANRTMVHPREVFYPAIKDMAVAIIVAHNHPSGRLDPSIEDVDITERLRKAAEIVGINLLDHLIVAQGGFYSFVENGLMQPMGGD